MLRIFNTLGRTIQRFRPVNNRVVNIFTCGPSVYQRAHIGNFRTFLFEDILVRYLEYSGYKVKRGMNLTDIEDKAFREAAEKGVPVKELTETHIDEFLREMELLRIKIPDYLPRASDSVDQAADLIRQLLDRGAAYWHGGNVYFDPLMYKGFGRLYGLDMSRWPKRKKRFHKDTYPGMQWNLGDFVLWHGYREGDLCWWDTPLGKGRPSWNIQDPSMISRYFDETLSIYCGGIDNLYRHHDYTLAILESLRPYPMARYWLHGEHLHVHGRKMSKSRGNIYYTDSLLGEGYDARDIRFFLIYGRYRERLSFSDRAMRKVSSQLQELRRSVAKIGAGARGSRAGDVGQRVRSAFSRRMDDDLDVRGAFDAVVTAVSKAEKEGIKPADAGSLITALREIDGVLRVIF
ncbi:MAG TPA: class I tRNA ligase family protein [Dissulfurispiraceae bacterium]|nr:class I tRNA ligase family protein [Dissulfurispiraceae bacterium]